MTHKSIDEINNILIVGAGTLGLRIALRCALDGYNVKMYDIDEKQLATAVDFQAKITRDLLKKNLITDEMAERTKTNLLTVTDLDQAVKDIDLISESIIENIDVKQAFYKGFAPRLAKGTIVTTNTSYLLPSQLIDSVVEPENFCAFHFHDVFNQVVVDVMPHSGTAQTVIDLLMEFGKRINQIPVFIKKESPGYIFNSILMAVLGQAGSLRVNDIGSIQDIDRSFMGNFQVPVGPFGMLDQIGLDTALHITSVRTDRKSVEFTELLKSFVDKGKLGYKTGEGFYSYPNPEYKQPNFLRG